LEQLATIRPENIVYADEAGIDNRDQYAYGWNKCGERFQALKSGRRQGRINMIAAYCNRQLIAPFTVEGACNRTVFETWIETCLIQSLKPGQWLVIDHATFHKADATPRRRQAQGNAHQAGGRIEQLIEQAGCHVLYLPPYSPDFNKIEQS
jgi:transposase